ncbi:hypothetical protein HY969_03330 [Candidatus Kaiserbacteria bacterium]|nr:hypothetical protein [Candidatus Kaiserbacteria bacterium]
MTSIMGLGTIHAIKQKATNSTQIVATRLCEVAPVDSRDKVDAITTTVALKAATPPNFENHNKPLDQAAAYPAKPTEKSTPSTDPGPQDMAEYANARKNSKATHKTGAAARSQKLRARGKIQSAKKPIEDPITNE